MSHHTITIATAALLDRPPAHASPVHVARPGCHHNGALGLDQYLIFVSAVISTATDRFARRRPGMPVYIVTPAMIHALVIGSPWCRSCPPDELEGRAAAVYALGSEQAVEDVREGLEDLYAGVAWAESKAGIVERWGVALEKAEAVGEMAGEGSSP